MRGGRQALAMLFFLGGAAGLGATGLEAAVVWSGTEGRFAPLWLSAADPPPGSFLELVELAEDSAVLGVDSVPAGFGAPALFLARQGGRYAARLRYGERILAETPVAWPSDAWRGHVILAVGLERASAASLENALLPAEPVRVVTIRPDELPPSALALDGISAVAITDTELTQAQRAALASWVASGGSLALFGSGAGSLSAEFPAVSDNPTAYGLGRVRVSPGQPEPGLAADGSWGRYLGLDSYERSRRPDVWNDASPALGWGSSLEDASSISGATLAVLMAWAAGLVLVLFLKKRRGTILAAYSLASLIIFAIAPASLGPAPRASAVRARVLVAGSGAYASVVVSGPDPLAALRLSAVRPERAIVVDLDFEGDAVLSLGGRDQAPRLLRPASAAGRALKRARPGLAELAAWYPDALGGFPASGPRAMLDAGRSWSILDKDSGRWIPAQGPPPWLGKDSVWALALADAAPGRAWLFAHAPLPAGRVTADRDNVRQAVWAMPLASGVVP